MEPEYLKDNDLIRRRITYEKQNFKLRCSYTNIISNGD